MATRAEQARLYNNAIAQGLTEDQALAQAGITDPDSFNFSPDGQLEPTAVGPGLRPNETIVPAGTPLYGDSDEPDEPTYRTTPVSSQTTTTSQETVTGGGSQTIRVQPTQYQDTAASQSAQSAADRVAAEKAALSAQLKAEGKTGAEVLRDPRYRALSSEQQNLQSQADSAKAPVPGTGGATVTDTPGADSTTSFQSSSPTFVTNDAGIEDPSVQTQEVAQTPAAVNRASFVPEPVTDTGGVPTQSLADIDGDTGFVPQAAPEPVPSGFSPYGEQDEPFDPDFRSAPDPALFTEEYVQGQDNPVEFPQEQDTGFSPYGEENEPADIVPVRDPFEVDGDPGYGSAETEFEADNPNLVTLEAPDPYEIDGAGVGLTEEEIQEQDNPTAAARQQATLDNARKQATLQAQRKQGNDTDWRFRISLAPQSTYLYNAVDQGGQPAAGILEPLRKTGGVIFPYTPTITTSYNATYDSVSLTHSNYRSYFYQSSNVGDINIQATFTAQDTAEAEYLLAVIHFFKSVTKMFYGANDAFAGAPPPLVYCRGFGEFQFNLHPCVVSQFNYNLPADVDYIRARSKNINGTDLLQRRDPDRAKTPADPFSGALARLSAAGVKKGAISTPPPPPSLGLVNATYVPTRIDITLILHPIQSREQVSKQFNLKQFANGDLLKGGFW